MRQEIIDAVVRWIGDLLHKGGVLMTIITSIIQDNAVVLSFGVGVLGLLIRWHYDRKEDKRREQLFNAQIRAGQQSERNAG